MKNFKYKTKNDIKKSEQRVYFSRGRKSLMRGGRARSISRLLVTTAVKEA